MLEIVSIRECLKHIGGTPSAHDDFEVRKLSGEIYYKDDFEPFTHRIYTISIYKENGDGNRFKLRCKTPYQIIAPGFKLNAEIVYHICMTEKFLLDYPFLKKLMDEMGFLRQTYQEPLELLKGDEEHLLPLHAKIMAEFTGNNTDRFAMIVSYLQVFLLEINRLSEANSHYENMVIDKYDSDLILAERFHRLLNKGFTHFDKTDAARMVHFYADKLGVHPGHLNVVLKKAYGKTAQVLLQEHLTYLAKNLLLNTKMSIKSVAYQLAFKDPAHFNNFFKKHTGATPARYRETMVAQPLLQRGA